CLGWFLERVRDTDLLPSRTVHARWGQYRRAIDEALSEYKRAWRVAEARTVDTWDPAAEAEWLAQAPTVVRRSGADPVVSVIMPVWNREDLLGAAIASVQTQTLEDWELIVVD